MYIMYVDESGDTGLINSSTKYFILSAIVVHEADWFKALKELNEFRDELKKITGLKKEDEIHCSCFINNPGDLMRIPMNMRVDIIKKCVKWIASRKYLSVYSIRIEKDPQKYESKSDVFEKAWTYLIQRFENTIASKIFNTVYSEFENGIIIADNTDAPKLRSIYRKMRHFNYVPNRKDMFQGGAKNKPIVRIIEDPVFRDSKDSYFIQLCDVVAYIAYQRYSPNRRAKSKGLHNYYKNLESSILTKVTRKNDLGIVEF